MENTPLANNSARDSDELAGWGARKNVELKNKILVHRALMHGLWMSKRREKKTQRQPFHSFLHYGLFGLRCPVCHTHPTRIANTRARPTMRLTSTANVARLHFYYSHSPIYLRSKLNNNARVGYALVPGSCSPPASLNFPSRPSASTLPLRSLDQVSCLALCAFVARC